MNRPTKWFRTTTPRNSHYPCKSFTSICPNSNGTFSINHFCLLVSSTVSCSARRAAYRWARDRAKIASRWSWLLAQISDLEYRIRQHHELHLLLKMSTGAVEFEGTETSDTSKATTSEETTTAATTIDATAATTTATVTTTTSTATATTTTAAVEHQQLSVNGYRGTLPGNVRSNDDDNVATKTTEDDDADNTGTARTRPFKWNGFKKRKLLQSTNLHKISRRAARPWYDPIDSNSRSSIL